MPEPRYQHSDSWGDCRIIQPREIELEFDQEIDPSDCWFLYRRPCSFHSRQFSGCQDKHREKAKESEIRLWNCRFLKPLPIDIKNGTSQLTTVGKGRYKWRLRIVNASGHVIAQTDTKMTGAEPLIGGQDNAILKIAKERLETTNPGKLKFMREQMLQ